MDAVPCVRKPRRCDKSADATTDDDDVAHALFSSDARTARAA
jgi:hypothetical protein